MMTSPYQMAPNMTSFSKVCRLKNVKIKKYRKERRKNYKNVLIRLINRSSTVSIKNKNENEKQRIIFLLALLSHTSARYLQSHIFYRHTSPQIKNLKN